MASGLLIDYLGSGVIADRPAAPTLFADSLGLWWATDTTTLSAWDGSIWTDVAGGGGGTPGGADKDVQFNDAGVFGGETVFQYDKTSNVLQVSNLNILTAGLISSAASSTANAGLRIPQGTAPTSPVNGDMWTTTAGLYVRINGSTIGPLTAAGGDVVGPASAIDSNLAAFDSTTGKLLKDGGSSVTKLRAQSIQVACSDETTALTTGTAKVTFRMPYAFTLTGVRASVTTAPTGSVLTVDINEGGTTILSTKITIDATEKTSTTAATPPVISDSSLADDAEITIDIDTIGSTIAGAGLKVTLLGYQT